MSEPDRVALRRLMVSNQLRPNKVVAPAVLAAMEACDRAAFAPGIAPAVCYRDTAVPLAHGRALNPPIATGRLLDRAQVQPGERALVVGAATGYVAALLATIGAHVTALEEDATLLATARTALAGYDVTLVEGPLAAGAPDHAPYDLVYLDGAVEVVPDAIVAQIAPGGRLVGGLQRGRVTQLVDGRAAAGGFGTVPFGDVEMVPLPGFAPAPAFAF